MIEGTPGQPYGGTMSEFNTVQDNMRKRRLEAASVLAENEAVCTVTSFPRLDSISFMQNNSSVNVLLLFSECVHSACSKSPPARRKFV